MHKAIKVDEEVTLYLKKQRNLLSNDLSVQCSRPVLKVCTLFCPILSKMDGMVIL